MTKSLLPAFCKTMHSALQYWSWSSICQSRCACLNPFPIDPGLDAFLLGSITSETVFIEFRNYELSFCP